MENFNQSIKYEIVLGLEIDHDTITIDYNKAREKWQEYAKEFYDLNYVYVSAISVDSRALYNIEWGCPNGGEYTMTFHCTANPEFIKDLDKYEEGVLYITKRLKRDFKQHTITITKMPVTVCYLTDEDNLEEYYE